jgi:polysaccharide deacetylase family protein (PEP-CTERM system associated)
MNIKQVKNIFTVDLEDWYQGNELIKLNEKYKYEDRIEYSTNKLLELLDEFSIKATFFVLAHTIESKPELLRQIYNAGHEIASHGYSHELIYNQTRRDFFNETKKSKNILEDIIGSRVNGYRASNWSITEKSLWAIDILQELGFEYDSSIYPTKNYLFGIPNAPVEPYYHKNGLLEIPPSVFKFLNYKIPFSGGFFLRAMPDSLVRTFLNRLNSKGKSVVFYIHPWELDQFQPKDLNIPLKNKIIHYFNINKTESKLRRMFNSGSFVSIENSLAIIEKNAVIKELY